MSGRTVVLALILMSAPAAAQSPVAQCAINARVVDVSGAILDGATVTARASPNGLLWTARTDSSGRAIIDGLEPGQYVVSITKPGFGQVDRAVVLRPNVRQDLDILLSVEGVRDAVIVQGPGERIDESNGLGRMDDVVGTAIYAGKKNEVLLLDRLPANLAIGNTRQVFGKVAGTNIWEIDSSGLQIGISNRGLDPNRSWEMNSRQNGYDITADVFGYPEAYFTPPLEAVERIEVVRGSASLQYGPQFGGLVNYVLKKAPANRRATFTSIQTGGSNGLFNSHNRVGGRSGRVAYNGWYHHRQGDGWRPNGEFDNNSAFGSIELAASEKLRVGFEFTGLGSTVQMPGGITDALFEQDARQSIRPRNWFGLRWLLPSLNIDYVINSSTQLSVRANVIRGRRHSLFNATPVALGNGQLVPDDPNDPRTLYHDAFHNVGVETRLAREYRLGNRTHTLAGGVRYYRGKTLRQHGVGYPGMAAQFDFFEPDVQRNMHFHTTNVALFAENLFRLGDRLTVTPGVRLDRIDSTAEGRPVVGLLERDRLLPLFGVGVAWRLTNTGTLYANTTQAYRATLFNDLWRPDPTIIIDPDLEDMSGYVSELGVRGSPTRWLSFDVGGFYMRYHDRLGLLTPGTGGQTQSLWTNVADSRHVGIESYAEVDLARLARPGAEWSLSVSSSVALIDARYGEGLVDGHRVEFAPRYIGRWGLTYRQARVMGSLQYSAVGRQFTDASNTLFTPDAVQGLIPGYRVWDASAGVDIGRAYFVKVGINNVADARYFTRRGTSYPGPGLIPADGRSVQVSFGVRY